MAKNKTEKSSKTETATKSQELYFFYSIGCAFCKQLEPLVDTLISEGNNILKLDTNEPDNKGLKEELEKKHNKQCGTPWLINPETGTQVCGFKEKDVLDKWIDGEDIPTPPRPTSRAPKIPFHGAPDTELDAWKIEYEKWREENSHVPTLLSVEKVLEHPRPKSDPPPPPRLDTGTQEEQIKIVDEWKLLYEKWYAENRHITTLQPPDALVERIKQQAGITTTSPNRPNTMPRQPINGAEGYNELSDRIDGLDQKLDRLLRHLGA